MEDIKTDELPPAKGKWKSPAVYLAAVVFGGALAAGAFLLLNRGGPYDNGPVAVEEGVLYRCKEPTEFVGRNVLKELGIKTVVNTRIDGEKDDNPAHHSDGRKLAADAGAEFIAIPVGEVLPSDDQVLQFLRIVRFGKRPVLVHCQLGKSRTGAMAAAYRIVMQGWNAADAMKEMQSFGYHDNDGKHAQRVALLERLEKDRDLWLAKVNSPSGGVLESGAIDIYIDAGSPSSQPADLPTESTTAPATSPASAPAK